MSLGNDAFRTKALHYKHLTLPPEFNHKVKKVKLSRYTPWRHMGERRYSSYSYLTSALDGGEWSASRPGRAILGERTPGTHWIGGWVGPRAGLDAGARRKILCPCRGSNPDRPARSQTLYCLSYRISPYTTIIMTISTVKLSLWLGTTPWERILNLGTRWERMVSFMLRQLYPQGKIPLVRRLGGSLNRSGSCGSKENYTCLFSTMS
jgi:hypothetical protein